MDNQRHVVGGLIHVSFHAGKRHSVIRGQHDQGVFEQTAFFQLRDHTSDVPVEVFHLIGVIEHVVAHFGGVRPVSGHAFDLIQRLAALGHATAILILTMRLKDAGPKYPRAILGRGVQKGLEIRGIIV